MARWQKLEQRVEPPLPRSSHTITWVKGRAYCMGGENQPRVPIGSTVHVYDLLTGKWSAVGPSAESPSPRVGHTAVAAGDMIYMFGGRYGIAMGDGVPSPGLNNGRYGSDLVHFRRGAAVPTVW